MAYGIIKVDTIIFDQGGADQNATVSGIYRAITSGVTVSGTIAGAVLIGTTTVSGTTVTGTTANFASGVFTTQVSGATVTGTQSSFTSGNFVTLSGATATFTSGVIASGTAAAPSLSILGDLNTGIYSPGADQVAVATNGTGRLFVDASGRVGIGTSSQEQRLTVLDNSTSVASGSTLTVNGGTFNTGGEGGSIAFSNTVKTGITHAARIRSGLVFLDVQETGNLIFDTNGGAGLTERLRITYAGLVGIGTSAPVYLVDAQGGRALFTDNSSTFSVGVRNRASLAPNGNFWIGATNAVSPDMVFSNNAGNERMRITDAGLVGIGTTSPGDLLTLNSAGYPLVTFNDNGTFRGQIGYTFDDGYFYVASASTLGFRANGSERARIDSSGRLLVGTSTARSNFFNGTASAALQLEGNSTGTASLSITRNDATADGNALILAKARSTAYAILQYVNGTTSDDRIGRISFQGADGTNMVPAANIEAFVDGTPGANDMPGRLVFSTTADGAASPTEAMRINNQRELLIGTTTRTANGGVLQVSNGITFPATAVACTDANTLDDYEEGTWTPTDDSGAGLSFTVSNCRYTKIGRAVAIQGTITYPSTANTNNAAFTSFPFAAADNITLSVIYTDASVANFTYLSSNTATCFLLTPGLNVINATMSGKSFTFAGVYAI